MATFTRADLVNALCSAVGGLSKKDAVQVVEVCFESIKQTLERGETLKISGFGTFAVRDKKARPGRNPQTGEPITIAARRVVSFKSSDVLKRKLNA